MLFSRVSLTHSAHYYFDEWYSVECHGTVQSRLWGILKGYSFLQALVRQQRTVGVFNVDNCGDNDLL